MNTHDDKSFALRQVAAMDRFFSDVDAHPLMGPLTRQRREEFARRAAETPAEAPRLKFSLPTDKLHAAAERVASVTSKQEEVMLAGTFRGVTLDTGRFDFAAENGTVISGNTADTVDEGAAEGFMKFFNRPCHAALLKTTVETRGKKREQFELKGISE